ncbi:hypothetical protein V5799_033126 [Amblyomma americanum]|uniref:Uncharacterized protein n=1 Tax=Amblyomma americanum TaxID=6943 RepID=A0AAQ4DP76_AMBAM
MAAIDTALYFRKHALTSDICVSVTLSAFRFWTVEDKEELGSFCENASAVAYADVCVNRGDKQSSEGATPTRHAWEGVTVKRKGPELDAFDDPDTVAEKLHSAKLALSLSAQPHWNFCLVAFNLEHGDSAGACGNRFARLEVARSYLHGKLKRR